MEISDNVKVIMCVGLPGLGQLELCNSLTEFELHINFVNSFYSEKLREDIKSNKKVCLVDPRLCKMDVFRRYYQYFKEDYSDREILVIVFEKNPEKCDLTDINYEYYNKIYDVNNYEEYNYIRI